MARKALARKISYEDARSYRQTWPNPIGVTAIAAVNGKDAYAKRYRSTRSMLGKRARANPPTSELVREGEILADKKMDPRMIPKALEHRASVGGWKKSQVKDAVKQLEDRGVLDGKSKGRSKRADSAPEEEKKVARKTAKSKPRKKAAPKRKKTTRKAAPKRKKTTRKAAPKRKKTTRKAAPKRKKVTRKPTKATKAKARQAVKRVRPQSKVDLSKATPAQLRKLSKADTAQKRAAEAKKKAAKLKREAARKTKSARKAISRVAKRKPAPKRKKTATKPRKRLTPAQRRARNAALRRKRRKTAQARWLKGGRKFGRGRYQGVQAVLGGYNVRDTYMRETPAGGLSKVPLYAILGFSSKRELDQHWGDGKYADEVATTIKGKKITWDQLIRRRMDAIRKRRSKAADRMLKRGGMFVPNERRGKTKSRALTYEEWETAMKKNRRRRRRRTRKNVSAKQRAAARRNIRKAQAARRSASPNRRRRRKATRRSRSYRRRSYRRNQAMTGSYSNQLQTAFKLGLVITGGYAAHRVLSKLLAEALLADNEYKDLISGAIVGAAGVPLSVKFVPGDAKLVGAGMMVSFAQSLLTTVLNKMDTTGKWAGYLSGLGSYYQYSPGQVYPRKSYRGIGEYYTPTSGFGAMTQAAAGMGQLTQAAAGTPQLTQAAAGLGAKLTQAAAGAGEYVAADLAGIGDYEEVIPEYTRPVPVDEGIAPDLTTAEQSLDVAEAAAGVGGMGQYKSLPARSSVEPGGVWAPMSEAPNGARSGSFTGKNGIFGS